MKYLISSDRWKFNKYIIYTKDNIDIQLDYNANFGIVEVDLSEPHDFGTTDFDSRNFNNWTIEETGEECFEDWEILTGNLDDETIDKIYEEFDHFVEGSDDYYNFRDYIEALGWEIKYYYVIIDEFEVEEIE